jgi:hypothetical protein
MGVTWEALSPEQVREVVDVLKETCDALLRSQGEPTPQVGPGQPPGLTCAPSLIPSFAARFQHYLWQPGSTPEVVKDGRFETSRAQRCAQCDYCGCPFVGEGHGQFNAVAVGRLAGPSVTANKLPTAQERKAYWAKGTFDSRWYCTGCYSNFWYCPEIQVRCILGFDKRELWMQAHNTRKHPSV